MDNISLVVAFGAGVISFLSPCVLPLVPAYIGQLAGVQALDPSASRWATLPHAVSFVLGFGAVFVGMGLAVGLLGGIPGRLHGPAAPGSRGRPHSPRTAYGRRIQVAGP